MPKFKTLKPGDFGRIVATGESVYDQEESGLFKDQLDENTRLKLARDKYFSADNTGEGIRIDDEEVAKFNKEVADYSLQRNKYFYEK